MIDRITTVQDSLKDFIIKMLDLCEGSTDAKVFLYQDDPSMNCPTKTMLPPRIDQALGLNVKSFVLHDYCQQFARDVFYRGTTFNNKTQGSSSSMFRHLLFQTLGFPIVSVCHVLSKVGIGGPLRFCKDFDLRVAVQYYQNHFVQFFGQFSGRFFASLC